MIYKFVLILFSLCFIVGCGERNTTSSFKVTTSNGKIMWVDITYPGSTRINNLEELDRAILETQHILKNLVEVKKQFDVK